MTDKVFDQIFKRIDNTEDEIKTLRVRSHDYGNTLMNHTYVLDKQVQSMENIVERVERLEERTRIIDVIRQSWKIFGFLLFASIVIGMWLGSDVHRAIQVISALLGKSI